MPLKGKQNIPDRLSLDPVLDVSDRLSSLLLIPEVLSDSDELRICSLCRYVINVSLFVRSGGSENDAGMASDTEAVLLGGEGAISELVAIALADRFRAPGLRGDFPGEGIMSSNTGGWGESVPDFSCTLLLLDGLPGFLGGVLVLLLLPLSLPLSLRNVFLPNRTAVRLFTPTGGVEGADLSEWTLAGVPGFETLPSAGWSSEMGQ